MTAFKYIGCCVCSFRIVEEPPHLTLGCPNCGSTVVVLEESISAETAAILRKHGQFGGTPEPPKPTINYKWEDD